MSINTIIIVKAVGGLIEGHEDEGVEGAYECSLRSDIPPDLIATASLDRFHEKIGISELDDFSITVHDERTGEVISEKEDADSYKAGHYALSVELISEDPDYEFPDAKLKMSAKQRP